MTVHALNPSLYERSPPANVEAEQEVLGALIARPETFGLVQSFLLPEHFAEPVHAATFEAIRAAVEAGQTPSLAALRQHLGARGFNADIGGVTLGAYVGDLVIKATFATGVAASARMIRDLWALRQLMAVGDDIARDDAGYDPGAKLSERLAQVDAIRAAMMDRERTSATSEQAAGEVLARIESVLQGNAAPLPRTGLYRLDDELGGGLQPSTLIVVAARTSMGKSALGIEIADAVARQGFGCVYHSLEMAAFQVSARQIASRLERAGIRLPYQDIMRGKVSPEIAERIADIRAELRSFPLQIEEAGGVTIADVAATSERRVNAFARKGIRPGVVIIDHVHQLKAMRRDRTQEGDIREGSAGALALAKRLDMPVLLLAQLNRQTEGREDKRPGPADLRGSGALEEDADTLIFPFRPAYYIERSPEYRAGNLDKLADYDARKHDLELIIDKNRAGRSNVIVKAWIDVALNAIRNEPSHGYAELRQ